MKPLISAMFSNQSQDEWQEILLAAGLLFQTGEERGLAEIRDQYQGRRDSELPRAEQPRRAGRNGPVGAGRIGDGFMIKKMGDAGFEPATPTV